MLKGVEKSAVFIINLKQSIERKNHMQELCDKIGLRATFVEAVDGRHMAREKFAGTYSKEAAVRVIGRELSGGEIGCALSHITAYKRIIEENLSVALILEDDIEFDESMLDILSEIGSLPRDWELVLLGHHSSASRSSVTMSSLLGRKVLGENHKLLRPVGLVCGTYGYLINGAGARKLLELTRTLTKPIDHYTGDDSSVNLYIVHPSVVRINEYLSDIYHSMEDRQELLNTSGSLVDTSSFSWYKKLAISLNVYKFLNIALYVLRKPILILKPLRTYGDRD